MPHPAEDDDYDEEDEPGPPPAKKAAIAEAGSSKGGAVTAGTGEIESPIAVKTSGKGSNKSASKGKRAAAGTVSQGKKVNNPSSKKKVTLGVQVPEEDDEQKDDIVKDEIEGGEGTAAGKGKYSGKEEEDEEEEEEEEHNLDLDLSKFPTMTAEKMQAVLEKFTPEQMSRYECYRRSGFQRSTMKRFLQTVVGSVVSVHMAIVMSGITKIFVGELVETARVVMSERGDRGPIRPSHMRESYRRLKQQGKVPIKKRPNFFH